MSDPTEPKAPPATPTESPTRTFVLKIDGWMADLMKDELDPNAPPPADAETPKTEPEPPPEGEPKAG